MADILKWARDRKKNVESIANKAQGVYHQANVFDNGRTFDTNQRGVTPGTANPVDIKSDDTPGFQWTNNSLTRGLSRGYDQVNIADNGRSWQTRAPAPENRKSAISEIGQTGLNIGKSLVKAPVQMLNTAAAQAPQAFYTLQGIPASWEQNAANEDLLKASKSGDPEWIARAKARSDAATQRVNDILRMQDASNSNFNDQQGGLFNMGTFYNENSARTGDAEGVKDVIGGTIMTAATVAPFTKGGSFATLAGTKPLAAKTAILAAEGAGTGGVYSVGSQLQEKGSVDGRQVLKDAAIGGAIGGAIPVAGAATKAVVRKAAPTVTKAVEGAISRVDDTVLKTKAGIKPMTAIQQVVKDDKTYQILDKRVSKAVQNAATSTGALKQNYRQEAIELIRLRNARVRELAPDPGGYINPGAMADDAKNAANKIKNKVTGKSDDYRGAHKLNDTTPISAVNNIDDTIAQVKSKYGLTRFDQEDIKNLKKIMSDPEADVKIYRTSPKNELNPDDWVTTSKSYANDIKRQNGGKVYEHTVKAKELGLPNNIDDNPSLARFSAFKYTKADDVKNAANKVKKAVTGKGDEGKTYYHGTDADFDTFDLKRFGQTDEGFLGKGVYLTSEKDIARDYGSKVIKTKVKLDNPLSIDDPYAFGGVHPNSIKNKLGLDSNATPELISKTLKERGYDGVVVNKVFDNGDRIDGIETLVLDPRNIERINKPNVRAGFVNVNPDESEVLKAVKVVKDRLSGRKDTRQIIPTVKNKPQARVVPPKTEPAVKNTRFATKTVQGSQEVSEAVKKGVRESDNTYQMVSNKDQLARSEKFIKKNNIRNATADVKERLSAKDFDDQTISDAIAVAKKLDARGGKTDLIESTAIYNQISEKLTKAGQTVQAARLLNNRTPEGMKHWALSQLKKEGVSLAPDKATKLEKLIGDVRKAKPDSYDAGLSRYRVAEFVAKNTPHSASSKAIQIWKAGLLSSPRTTAGNLFANSAETIFKKGWVDPVAAATDKLMSVFTGKRSNSYTLRGIPSGTKEGIVKGVKYFKTGYDPRNPDVKWDVKNIHFSDKPAGKAAEAYTQTIFRLMGSQDQPFYYANMRNSLYDQAITAAKNQGLKGTQRQAFIRKFVTEPAKDALELADKEGRYAVFQNETALGKAASRLKGMDGAGGDVAEFIMPFSGVPSSIATRIIERTPIGTATEIVKQMKRGKFDQRAMAKAIANGSAVVPLIGAGYALAQNNQISLAYPKDKTQRELWEAEGRQPYSIKVGDEWLSMNYFQPGGTIISAGAEYKNALDEGKTQTEALQVAAAGAGKAFTEQSFLKGVSGGLNAITDPAYAGEKFVDQTAGSIVPNFIRSAATASDTVKREARTVPEQIMRGIPGLRQKLDVKKDLFGRDVKENTTAPNVLLNPLRPSTVRNADDPTTTEIRRLYDADEGISPTQIKKDAFMKNGEGTKLTDKEIDDFNAEVGKNVKTEWDKVMSDERYVSLNDAEKKKLLRRVNEDVYGALKRKYEADRGIGEYSSDFTGEETKLSTNEKRYLEGKAIDYYAKDSTERNPSEEYEYQKQKFEEEKDSYNEIERAQKETEIRRLGIKKDYDEVITDLYDLNKNDAYDYVNGKGDAGWESFMKAVEYGDKLVEAGIEEKNKWRDKYGNIDFESGNKSSSKGKKAKRPWQAPTSQAISLAGGDNRQLVSSVSSQIKARRTRRKFA